MLTNRFTKLFKLRYIQLPIHNYNPSLLAMMFIEDVRTGIIPFRDYHDILTLMPNTDCEIQVFNLVNIYRNGHYKKYEFSDTVIDFLEHLVSNISHSGIAVYKIERDTSGKAAPYLSPLYPSAVIITPFCYYLGYSGSTEPPVPLDESHFSEK